MEKVPDGRAGVALAVRTSVMSRIADLYKQLSAEGRKVSSDTHELGWLIMRSKDYLEFYGDEDFKAALLRWLKGTSSDTPDGLMKMLKATAVRVEVRHFDGYSALADLIKNPKRTGIALVARELALAKTGKCRVLWHLVRAIRLSTVFLSPGGNAADAQLLKSIFSWSRQEKLFRLAEAALCATAKVDIPAAEAACKECLTLPLASKVLAIASLHLLRELHLELLEPAATRLLASQDDPYVTLNALEAMSAGPPSSSGDLAKALLTRFSLAGSREVRDALVAALGEKVAVDITESLKEPALTGDDDRRAAALAILDRRITAGLAANRDGTIEFLYRVLRGDHEASRRSAALMLWKMGDDYAPEVLRDLVASGSDEAAGDVLRRLPGNLREPMVSALAPLFRRESAAVQGALRDLLLKAEDPAVRTRALEMALLARGGAVTDEDGESPLLDETAPAVEVRSERSTFKFERENMQELVMFFSDIQGYSKKAQVLTPMQLSALLQEYEKILLTHIETHRGELVKRMGDGHMIVFQEPLPGGACGNPAAEIPETLQPLPRREHQGGDPHRDPQRPGGPQGAGRCPRQCGEHRLPPGDLRDPRFHSHLGPGPGEGEGFGARPRDRADHREKHLRADPRVRALRDCSRPPARAGPAETGPRRRSAAGRSTCSAGRGHVGQGDVRRDYPQFLRPGRDVPRRRVGPGTCRRNHGAGARPVEPSAAASAGARAGEEGMRRV